MINIILQTLREICLSTAIKLLFRLHVTNIFVYGDIIYHVLV